MSDDIIERELHYISLKINTINTSYEILLAILSASLSLLTSYYWRDMLNLWGISFCAMFGIWTLWSFLSGRRARSMPSKGDSKTTPKAPPNQLTKYFWEIRGKTLYSGIQAFGILSATSLVIYLILYTTDKAKNDLWNPSLLIFLLILTSLTFINEQRIITLFEEFGERASTIENFVQRVSIREATGYILGFLTVIFIILRSFWAMIELLMWVYSEHSPIAPLLVIFQYILVWALMSAINKNQILRDLTNALICLQNLQYNSENNRVSTDKVALCVKHTHFLKLSLLKILEFYLYIPHPLYEQILKNPEKEKQQ